VSPLLVLAAALCAAAALLPPEIHPAGRVVVHLIAAAAALALGFARDGAPPLLRRAALLLLPPAIAAFALASGGRARGLDEVFAFAAFVLAVLLGRRLAAQPDGSPGVAVLLALLGLAVSIQAILQHHWAYPQAAAALRSAADPGADSFLVRLEAGRPAGPFSLPAALAGFLALSLPMTLAALRSASSARLRTLCVTALAAQAYALLLTRSLGGLLAATVALALGAAGGRARTGRVVLAAALVFAAGAAFFVYARRAEIGARPGGDPISLRLGNWRVALEMIRDHPILGVGPGRFAPFYPRYVRPGMNETQFAHNSYLQIAATWGAWTLPPLALLALGACVARRGRQGPAGAAAAAAGVGFLLHNACDFTFFLPGVALPAAVLLGVGSAAPRKVGAGGADDEPGPGAVRGAMGRIAAIGCALLFFAHAGTSDRAAWRLDRARTAALRGETGEAEREAIAAAKAYPIDPDPWAFLAQSLLARQATGPQAEARRGEAAARAVRLEPESAILHHTLALDRAAAQDPAGAFLEEERAHRLFPEKPLYRPAREAAR
jgi:O-antigen ligase